MNNRIVVWIVVLGLVVFSGSSSAQDMAVGPTTEAVAGETPVVEHWIPPLGLGDILSINAYAFEAWSQAENGALSSQGAQRYLDGTTGFLIAPVELPDGSAVTFLGLDALDNHASHNVELLFSNCPLGATGCTIIGSVNTSGTPGQTFISAPLSTPHVIDNEANTYLVQVRLGDDSNTTLNAVKVFYQRPDVWPSVADMSINPFAFEPWSVADRGQINPNSVQRYCGAGTCFLVAPVELPSGTLVTRIELDAYDNGSGSVKAELGRCPVGSGSCSPIGEVETVGAPATVQVGADLPAPELIDNYTYSYFVQVQLDATASYAVTGVRLQNLPPSPEVGVDRLTMSAFAFEPWALGHRTLLDAWGSMRYCNGDICSAIGPVELPSGAWIKSLDAEVLDNSPDDISFFLSRCLLMSTNCQVVDLIGTTGTPGMTVIGTELARPEFVDNLVYSYAIQVVSGADSNTGFFSVSMEVDTRTVFEDGFDLGDLSRWSGFLP